MFALVCSTLTLESEAATQYYVRSNGRVTVIYVAPVVKAKGQSYHWYYLKRQYVQHNYSPSTQTTINRSQHNYKPRYTPMYHNYSR